MKNIHILSTDQPSRLWIDTITGKLVLDKEPNALHSQQIYITSDEEIKEGDWIYDSSKNDVIKRSNFPDINGYIKRFCKKIILTTDQDLIKNGVQAIDDEFLEWFVKNSSCEFVEVELEPLFPMYRTFIEDIDIPPFYGNLKRKIIIPQEEPKQEKEEEYFKHLEKDKKEFAKEWEEIRQEFLLFDKERANTITSEGQKTVRELQNTIQQETLEEAAEKEFPLLNCAAPSAVEEENLQLLGHRRSFIKGAKWQAERMYSEEEVRKAIQLARLCTLDNVTGEFVDLSGLTEVCTWGLEETHSEDSIIEQFKKK